MALKVNLTKEEGDVSTLVTVGYTEADLTNTLLATREARDDAIESAATATTQAGIATTQAGISSSSAGSSAFFANQSSDYADASSSSMSIAIDTVNTFVDTTVPAKVQEITDHTEDKKDELDTYVDETTGLKHDLSVYESGLEDDLDSHAVLKKTELDTYRTSTVQPAIDTYVSTNITPDLDQAVTDATTQAGIATTKASNASLSEAAASGYSTSAETSAVTATTQAGIATSAVNTSTTNANTTIAIREKFETQLVESGAYYEPLSYDSGTNTLTIPRGVPGVNGENGLTPNYIFSYNATTGDLEYSFSGYTTETTAVIEEIV